MKCEPEIKTKQETTAGISNKRHQPSGGIRTTRVSPKAQGYQFVNVFFWARIQSPATNDEALVWKRRSPNGVFEVSDILAAKPCYVRMPPVVERVVRYFDNGTESIPTIPHTTDSVFYIVSIS
jgi:hypothetical protein